jgi:hypothetical protein
MTILTDSVGRMTEVATSELEVTEMATTPEELVFRTPVPDWAAGAECVETGREDYEVWELRRDGETIGWMYDEGDGYRFAEGEHNTPAEA